VRVSVIVPVYNVERWLRRCLDSLSAQTMPKSDMEAVVVDDGSPDDSWRIVEEYAAAHPWIRFFRKPNGGLSSARNFGIQQARGRYLMYLDSDDALSPDAVKACADFFDQHYDEVDLVTYKDQPYRGGKPTTPHFRYRYLSKTGVYDLARFPYLVQTRVNIATKNLGQHNVLFDETPRFRQEDQDYNARVLTAKMAIGYVVGPEYRYTIDNDESIRATSFNAIELFETSLAYFERLFANFPDKVPQYFQAMFVSDIAWRVKQGIFWPYHYEEQEFAEATARVSALLARVDARTIIGFPAADSFMKQYLLKLSPTANVAFQATENGFQIMADGGRAYWRSKAQIVIGRIRVANDRLECRGFVKSPVFDWIEGTVYAVIGGREPAEIAVDTFTSARSYIGADTLYADFQAFHLDLDLDGVESLHFEVEFDGHRYLGSEYWFYATAVIDPGRERPSYVSGGYEITFRNDVFRFGPALKQRPGHEDGALRLENPAAYTLRRAARRLARERRLWLYEDWATVDKDNGYWQFLHDFDQVDGVERRYVLTRPLAAVRHLFEDRHLPFLIPHGSEEHRRCYLAAEKVLSAFFGLSPVNPFEDDREWWSYADLFHAEVVYLQHGVLHADMRTRNDAERCLADKVVVSSPMEARVYSDMYHYREGDVIPTGMARFDHMSKDPTRRERRILYAPSWRSYFTTSPRPSQWNVNAGWLAGSAYYTKICQFLADPRLEALLDEHDYVLDFKPHPILTANGTEGLFPLSDRVRLAPAETDDDCYAVMMTDISSYVYDFVWRRTPILYFMPDYPQFKVGMNGYRRLHLPLEEAFGPLTEEPDQAVDELRGILGAGGQVAEPYGQRMESFFYPGDDHAERLYQTLIKQSAA
jgi:glycosyltransferase involved in cell wall biosynthesis